MTVSDIPEARIGFDRMELPEDARILTYEEIRDMCIKLDEEESKDNDRV